MHESHTGAHMAEVLQGAVEEWKLTEKDSVVVTNNVSNTCLAVELTGFHHIQCFAHVLNLASHCVLKGITVANTGFHSNLILYRLISTKHEPFISPHTYSTCQ